MRTPVTESGLASPPPAGKAVGPAARRNRLAGTQDFLDDAIPHHGYLVVCKEAGLQDLLGAEIVAPMDERHLVGEVGQEERVLDGGIAAADHHDLAVAVEEAVAGGAGGDAEAAKALLGGYVQPLGHGAGRQDHRLGGVGRAGVADEAERAPRKIDRNDMVGHDPRPEMLGLQPHLIHEPGALDDVGKARIVLDVGRVDELPAGMDAGDHHRLEHGAGGVDGGRIAGRAGTDDDHLGVHAGESFAAGAGL